MSTRSILTFTATALLAAPFLNAQAPAPATPQPAATPGAAAPAGGTATATPAAKPKPLSMAESKGVVDLLEAMNFNIRMGEVGRHKDKEDKDLVKFANETHKEMTAQFTPIMDIAMAKQVKNLPTGVSKADKADIDKLAKSKPDKWKLEYFELFAKNGKRNVRTAENAVKNFADPQLKEQGAKVVAVISSQAEKAETAFKGLKDAKKDAK